MLINVLLLFILKHFVSDLITRDNHTMNKHIHSDNFSLKTFKTNSIDRYLLMEEYSELQIMIAIRLNLFFQESDTEIALK